MVKLQKLHDYLIKTGLIPAESMQVWTDEGSSFGINDAMHERRVITDKYQVNITIDDFPFLKSDYRKIKLALKWWLDVYQNEVKPEQPRFKSHFDIKTSSTAYIWIGFELSEDTVFENGNVTTCVEPLINPLTILPEEFSVYLKKAGTDEVKLIYGAG